MDKCALIYAQLHMLWVNRAQKASRATAGLTTDPMSIAMPIPSTFEATLSSFGRGEGFGCPRMLKKSNRDQKLLSYYRPGEKAV